MSNNNFFIQLTAMLHKSKSEQQLKSDAENLGDIPVKLVGHLDTAKTQQAIQKQLNEMGNQTINITTTVNNKVAQNAAKQAVNSAKGVANKNKISLDFDVNKQKLINQIKILGRDNDRLFSSQEMAGK